MANMTFGVNLIPHNNTPTGSNTYSLGNSNYKWKLYADELNGEPLADMKNLYYVEGPSTDTTSGTWTGTITGLSAYYDGLTVLYIPAIAGSDSGTTLNINSLGAITCYNSSSSSLDSQYTASMPILLVYNNSKWLQCNTSTGASSGSGDIGNTVILRFTYESNAYSCDHTFAEVYKAVYTDKVPVIAVYVNSSTPPGASTCLLHPVDASSTSVAFRGLYTTATATPTVMCMNITYASSGTITVNYASAVTSSTGDVGDTVIVKFAYASNAYTCDHTFAQVYKAVYTDKVPVVAVLTQNTPSYNTCILHPVSASTSSVVFRGLYYYPSGSNVMAVSLTLLSTNVINVTTATAANYTTPKTATSQLTNDGSPNSEYWDYYVLTHEIATDLWNPLLIWDPWNSNYYTAAQIREENTNEWKIYWEGSWSVGDDNYTTISTVADLYSFFMGFDPWSISYENTRGRRSFPVLIHEYNTEADDRGLNADYPTAYSHAQITGNNSGGVYNTRVYWLTLDCVKSNSYYDSSDNLIYTYSFIFSARDVRDEDNALVLRTFIMRGDGTEDIVAGIPIEIRDAILSTSLSTAYYTSTRTYFWNDADLTKLSVSGNNAFYEDVSWSGNLLTRENYTSTTVTNYSFANVESSGYMYLNCGDGGSSSGTLYYNSHVCTTNTITIPTGVTKLYVKIARSPASVQMRIGLIDQNATTAFDYTTGDGVQGIFDPTAGTDVYSIDVGNRTGATNYRIVISIRAQRQTVYGSFNILSVWFE